MENYKENPKKFLGCSDIASLTVRFPMNVMALDFGEDGDYSAYIVDETCPIPAHYRLVAEGESWLKIYDDYYLTFNADAKWFKIYRAGSFGCIIQMQDGEIRDTKLG